MGSGELGEHPVEHLGQDDVAGPLLGLLPVGVEVATSWRSAPWHSPALLRGHHQVQEVRRRLFEGLDRWAPEDCGPVGPEARQG